MAQNKLGSHTFRPGHPVYIGNWAAVAGKKEAEGPLGHGFDVRSMDTKFGERTWEQAEKKMQQLALYKLLDKARLHANDIDLVFSGDLLNQCIGSSFTLRNMGIPHLGLYGACSTMAQSLLLATMAVGGGYADRVVAMTSSHFAGSERQYRFPLGYGGQRTPTAQWTVTGSGAALVTSEASGVAIESATIGTVTDLGITDANNMGAAMAPEDDKLRPSGGMHGGYTEYNRRKMLLHTSCRSILCVLTKKSPEICGIFGGGDEGCNHAIILQTTVPVVKKQGGKRMSATKRRIALVLALALMCSVVVAGLSAKANAADNYVTVDALADHGTAAPEKDSVVPDANQYQYHKKGLSAFCHFGPNTFNEIEWGEHYGSKTPDEIFKLEEDFDAELLVRSLKEAGFGTLIVTAKHHDSFCIWDSAYTTYKSSQSSYGEYDYDGMGGDVLAEISAACTKYDLDMGLYLSPWDIHDPSYGYYTADGTGGNASSDAIDYNDYYNAQLEEILSNPIYGNDGHFVEIWMDGAKGSGANAQDYDFPRWFETIQRYEGKAAGYPADAMLIGAEAYSTVYWIGNESGLSNEETWSKVVVDQTNNTLDRNHPSGTHYSKGWSNGNRWAIPEADSKITSGWFWGNSKKTPATMADLANRYFSSVGYNSVMLLNIPPNNVGTVDQLILDRLAEFGEAVSGTFSSNKAKGAAISASEVRGNDIAYSPANLLDGDPLTYWTVEDGTASGSVIVDLGKVTTFDVVSIEESIEFGQRITSFRVEYSNDGQNWQTMQSGTTVGAKRLVRTAPVKAQYVKITVATNTSAYTYSGSNTAAKGSVPMLAEVGIYKAAEGFALGSGAPDGMDVIDERDSRFSFTGTWNNESGSQFPISQTSKWCNSGAGFTVSFTGSKIYLVGTTDPNHGTANVSIDGGAATSINTWASVRSLGQVIYTSPDLEHGAHTLTLTATGTIGIDGAYVINNGGVGMIGIENARYTMNEDSTMELKLVRVGGTNGDATVLVSPNPGTAVQGDYNTELIEELTFTNGVKELTAQVQTKRNTNTTGDLYFTVELSTETEDLILGFNTVARITILDTETHGGGTVTPDPDPEPEPDPEPATGAYTADNRFAFPAAGASATLEMDLLELHNNTSDDGGWPLQITEKDWASGGKFLNCLNGLDEAHLYYTAEAGTYNCTVYYRSGDSRNSLEWYDDAGRIERGEVSAGANDSAGATHQATFTIKVLESGDGMMKFSGGQYKGPQLDYIEITRAG